jgi:Helix-turn-helix domain
MAGRERLIARSRFRAELSLVRAGQEIHAARLGAGLTLAAVGEAIGRSHTEVSRIERGKAPLSSEGLWSRTFVTVSRGPDRGCPVLPAFA